MASAEAVSGWTTVSELASSTPSRRAMATARARPPSCPFRLLGQMHDEETGLCYSLMRYFDPATARWLGTTALWFLPPALLWIGLRLATAWPPSSRWA